jgi:hypothetical protein
MGALVLAVLVDCSLKCVARSNYYQWVDEMPMQCGEYSFCIPYPQEEPCEGPEDVGTFQGGVCFDP